MKHVEVSEVEEDLVVEMDFLVGLLKDVCIEV
jgi:hypothetical protein